MPVYDPLFMSLIVAFKCFIISHPPDLFLQKNSSSNAMMLKISFLECHCRICRTVQHSFFDSFWFTALYVLFKILKSRLDLGCTNQWKVDSPLFLISGLDGPPGVCTGSAHHKLVSEYLRNRFLKIEMEISNLKKWKKLSKIDIYLIKCQ